jgi:hypothetical protein
VFCDKVTFAPVTETSSNICSSRHSISRADLETDIFSFNGQQKKTLPHNGCTSAEQKMFGWRTAVWNHSRLLKISFGNWCDALCLMYYGLLSTVWLSWINRPWNKLSFELHQLQIAPASVFQVHFETSTVPFQVSLQSCRLLCMRARLRSTAPIFPPAVSFCFASKRIELAELPRSQYPLETSAPMLVFTPASVGPLTYVRQLGGQTPVGGVRFSPNTCRTCVIQVFYNFGRDIRRSDYK